MPRLEKHLFRLWCKNCNDFTLHERIFKDEFSHPLFSKIDFKEDRDYQSICECGCQYTSVSISEIPKEKVAEQRSRFKQKRSLEFAEITSYLTGGYINNIFAAQVGVTTKIHESDAGLEHEENLIREERKRIKEEHQKEVERFRNVGRNDTCLCGSGLKYKKCCLSKH